MPSYKCKKCEQVFNVMHEQEDQICCSCMLGFASVDELLDACDNELRDKLGKKEFDALAARGKSVVERALKARDHD